MLEYIHHHFRSLHYSLVLPAASRPNINIRISLLPKIFDNSFPILLVIKCVFFLVLLWC